MQGSTRTIGIILLLIILIISVIHLGVSIGIIKNFKQYGNVFRRERDLSVFNIIISICGIVISFFGLFTITNNRITLSKVAAIGCLLLASLAFISLIAAIAINFLAVDYVSSRFLDNMKHYKDSADARNSIDTIQRKYDCCGNNMWLDWATVPLYATPSNTNNIAMTSTSGGTIANAGLIRTLTTNGGVGINIGTTTKSGLGSSTNTGVTTPSDFWAGLSMFSTTKQNVNSQSDIQASSKQDFKVEVKPETEIKTATTNTYLDWNTTPNFHLGLATTPVAKNSFYMNMPNSFVPYTPKSPSLLQQALRKKRQANYGNIYGLPISYSVALPQSCCTNDAPSTFNSFDSYCLSNANNVPNSFHNGGCSNKIVKTAVSQALSIALMNIFLVVFALITATILRKVYSNYKLPPKTYRNSSIQGQQFQYGHREHDTFDKNPKTSVINYNTDYSIFQ